jgi:GPI-anchor transamidase subunit U
VLACVLTVASLVGVSVYLFGGTWLRACYFVVATMDGELRPNTGMVWYLFTEMFDHFLPFFRFFIHLHLFMYPVPLLLKLRHRPLFLCWMLFALLCVFHPFTTVSSTALLLLLLPLFGDLIPGIQFKFIIANALVYISCLAPILWNMWIYQGGGNANFYYALTLAHGLTLAVVIINTLTTEVTSHYRRKYNLPMQ